jgi:4-amino-4-deoxy-L-arabinose transferase-like glycosyltransferase
MEKIAEKFKKSWPFILGGLVVVGLFLFLRLYALTNLPVFVDEAIYVRWAQVMRAESTLRFLPLSDGKQPLYMWVLMGFLKFISDPLVAGRVVSVLSGLGTLVGIGVVSWYLFKSKKVVLATTLLWALSPYSVFFDKMALVDSLLGFFGIWTFFFALLTVKTMRFDFAMITGFLLGGAFLTKSPALFMAVLLPSVFLLAKWPDAFKAKIGKLLRLLVVFIPTLVIGYGLYNILRLGPNFHMIGIRNYDYVFPLSHLWLNPKDPFIFLVPKFLDWIWKMGPFPILLLGLLGLLVNLKKHLGKIIVITLWFIFPILVQTMFAKVFTARYIYFCLPYLFLLAGSTLLVKNKVINFLSALLIVLGIGVSLWFNYWLLTDITKANLPRSERSGYLEEWSAGQGIKEVADYIENLYLKDPKKIVVGTEGYFGTLPDGLQIYLNKYSEIIVIGVGLNFDKVSTSLMESRDFGNPTFFVANNSRFRSDPETYGFTKLAEYPKAFKPNGGFESLLFLEVTDKTTVSPKSD